MPSKPVGFKILKFTIYVLKGLGVRAGLRLKGLGCTVRGVGFTVQGLGFK